MKMSPPVKNSIFALFLLLVLSSFPLFGETSADFSTNLSVEWSSGEAELTFTFPLSEEQDPSPHVRNKFTRKSRSELGFSFVEEFSRLHLNSRQSIGDFLKKNPESALPLNAVAKRYTSSTSSFARDYSEFRITYSYSLYPHIIEHLFSHTSVSSPDQILRYVPSGSFSGIVIYVEKELPVHGTSRAANITPCLFPKIYNEHTELIVSKEMLPPETLKNWGIAGYFPIDKREDLSSRIGDVPLYIKAKALFGEAPTDIIIPNEGADSMLSTEHTIRLITEGKIAIVYTPQSH
ncbi:MAG: hypothetical protein ACLFMZ_10040 [Spirochaetaceae bacterium]